MGGLPAGPRRLSSKRCRLLLTRVGGPRLAVEKLEYDLYYVKHRSLFFDTWILVRTVGTILALRGR